MTILPLVIAPDERLNLPSALVTSFDKKLETLAADMLETMYHSQGIGLAAVQVGHHLRMIVVDVEWGSPRYAGTEREGQPGKPIILVNPEIIESSATMAIFAEGCLSFPEHYSDVERPAQVSVRYQDIKGEPHTIHATGILSVCIQHEIDHINGIVFVDHISKLKRDMILRKLKKAKRFNLQDTPEEQPAKV